MELVGLNLDIPVPTDATNEKDARKALNKFIRKIEIEPEDWIGFDTETTALKIDSAASKTGKAPLDWMNDTVTFWSLCAKFDGKYERYCFDQESFHDFIPVLENPNARLAGWNAKYDAHISWNCGINVWNSQLVDFQVCASMINENLQGRVGLKHVVERGYNAEWEEALNYKVRKEMGYSEYSRLSIEKEEEIQQEALRRIGDRAWKPFKMVGFKELFAHCTDPTTGKPAIEFKTSLYHLPRERVVNYASLDAYGHLKMAEHLIDVMKDHDSTSFSAYDNMWDYFLSLEVDVTETLWRMERRGIPVDVEYLQNLMGPMEEELQALAKEINRLAGFRVNLNSPQQVARLLYGNFPEDAYDHQEWRKIVPRWTKGGSKGKQPSTDDEALTLLKVQGSEEAKVVSRYRKVDKIYNTYVKKLKILVDHYGDGRIHPSFNQYGARTGRFSTENPNCFDGETEVLTKKGWVRFDEYKGQEVAQWSEDGSIDFVTPTKVYTFEEKTNINHYYSQQIDLAVTDDHRCLLRNRKTGELKVFKGSEYKEDYQQVHSGIYVGGNLEMSLEELWWLIAVQADGSWVGPGVDFVFSKNRKAERLEKILKAIGAEYSYKAGKRHRFYVKKGPVVEFAKKYLTEKKILGPWILDLNRDLLDAFCEEIFFWDGSYDRQSMYASNQQNNANWVQIALALSGRRAKIREYQPKNPKAKTSYQVDNTNTDYSLTTNIKKEKYEVDKTYCVSVPSTYILVRRNGKTAVTGQSQNFPNPERDEFEIRKAFIARPGRKLIVSDWASLEMRIMAHFSEDPEMISAIKSGKDMHCITASKMFGVDYEEIIAAKKAKDENRATDEQKKLALYRSRAKTVGFGIIYGAGGVTIGEQLEISKEEAEDLIALYFDAFPGVKAQMEKVVRDCRKLKFVTTILGRRRNLPQIQNQSFMIRSHAEREANNSVIQGTAADMAKSAMVACEKDERLQAMGVEVLNQIHDELVFEAPEEYAEEAALIIKDYMEHPFVEGEDPLLVPTPADVKIVDCWGDAK